MLAGEAAALVVAAHGALNAVGKEKKKTNWWIGVMNGGERVV